MELQPATGRRLEALLARTQRDGRLPSLVAGVVRDGGIAWSVGLGAVPGDPVDTQYRIGSITKTFTAVLVLHAREEGLVSLEAPLSAYVEEAPFGDRTLRALLSHTAGVPAEPEGDWWERHTGSDFAALVEANADASAPYAVGERFRYSNLAFGLLGEVVARVRGRDWWTLVRERILDPLGMARTTYQPEGPHAQGYSVSHLLATLTEEPHTDTGAMAPAGQLWSTLTDLATYAGFVLDGHPEVLPRRVLEQAATATDPDGGYGLGFRLVPGLVGHTGTMPGFRASFFCDRARGTAFVALANATAGLDSVAVARASLDLVEDAEPTVVAPWTPAVDVPPEVGDLVGAWHWGETAFEARWDGAALALVDVRTGEAWEEFRRAERGWLSADASTLDVVRRPDGSVDHLRCETYRFTRSPYAD